MRISKAIFALSLVIASSSAMSAVVEADLSGLTGEESSTGGFYDGLVVDGYGELTITYDSGNTDSRSGLNTVTNQSNGNNNFPTPHFALGAGDALTISATFDSPLRLEIWDLDTVSETETLTISNVSGDQIVLTGVDFNILNINSSLPGFVALAVMDIGVGNAITLRAGNQGAAFALGNIAAVPLPAAAWLFGSALLGFVSFSRRRSV
jgi:hypothetical protein